MCVMAALVKMLIHIGDDFAEAAEMLACIIEQYIPCETMVARDGREAVELATARRPDASLLDIDMPRLNGIDAAREIRVMYPSGRLLILAITGGPLLEDAKACGLFDDVFAQPVDMAVLCEALWPVGTVHLYAYLAQRWVPMLGGWKGTISSSGSR